MLADRLGLNDSWVEGVEQDGEWIVESSAPDALPEFIQKACSKVELKTLEKHIDKLVASGCRRPVVYFCLAQLSPDAEWQRAGGRWLAVPGATIDDDYAVHKCDGRLATREDIQSVSNAVKAAKRQLHRYQRELLLAADVKAHPLPDGITTRPKDPEDALVLPMNCLTWVGKLAEAYTAPEEAKLFKSKGLLYLIAYASMCSQGSKLLTSSPGRIANVRSPRGSHSHDRALARVASICTRKDRGWSPSELYTKLDKFRVDYPRLYRRLESKLKQLHDFASR